MFLGFFPTHPTTCQTQTEYVPLPPPATVNNYITPTSSLHCIHNCARTFSHTHSLPISDSHDWANLSSLAHHYITKYEVECEINWCNNMSRAATADWMLSFPVASCTCRCFHCGKSVTAAGLNLDNAPGWKIPFGSYVQTLSLPHTQKKEKEKREVKKNKCKIYAKQNSCKSNILDSTSMLFSCLLNTSWILWRVAI